MERNFKVNQTAAGRPSSSDGSNSRGNYVQEKKKYNKNEENYFEGTGVQKNKRLRRPRLPESSPSVPPGFNTAQPSPATPQVNAWAQKKGSALFQTNDEIDEEEQLLMNKVLEESLKTAEEDKKRRLERSRMVNLDLPTSSYTVQAEKDWEEDYRTEDFHTETGNVTYQEDSPKAELHFVETDVKEETTIGNQRRRSIPPKAKKVSPREKSVSSSVHSSYHLPGSMTKVSSILNRSDCSKESVEVSSKVDINEGSEDFFEPSRRETNHSAPINKINETTNTSFYNDPYSPSNHTNLHKSATEQVGINSDNLSTRFNSLTFGDTQGLFEKIKEGNELSHSLKDEIPSYLNNATDTSAQTKPPNPSEPSEMDILLHSFIRHEPPSGHNSSIYSGVSDLSAVKQPDQSDFFNLPVSPTSPQNMNTAQYYPSQQMADNQPMMNSLIGGNLPEGMQISNGRDSSSSVSGSPLQSMTPYGSFGKDIPANVVASGQAASQMGNLPYLYPYGAENNQDYIAHQLQVAKLMNCSIPTPIRGVIPVNPQTGQPQYRLPNSNIMMPSIQSQNTSLLMQSPLQPHMQQVQMPQSYMAQMLALEAARLQQLQHVVGTAESDGNTIKDQVTINQPQVQSGLVSQNQPQIQNNHALLSQSQMLTHNHEHLLQLQNRQLLTMHNQAQGVPSAEISTPKQEELLHQHAMHGARGQAGTKTQEELEMELQNALETIKQLKEQIHNPPQVPRAQTQTQPPWGVIPPNSMVPLPVNQYYPMGMIPAVHPHLAQQSLNNARETSPVLQSPQHLTGSMNIGSEMNVAQGPFQTPTEPLIGRGRGRIH